MSSKPALVPINPPIYWVPGVLSSGVKIPVHETDHSPLPGAEVKKMLIRASTPRMSSWHSA
jgi:hypothetical protein